MTEEETEPRSSSQATFYMFLEDILEGQRHGGRVPPLGKARKTEIRKLRPVDTMGGGAGGTN